MIIHFWDLPENRNYILLKEKFLNKLTKILENKKYSWKFKNRIKTRKISIKKIKQISGKENIHLEKFEKNIIWIGGNCSKGLSKPKLPFNLSLKEGARFIAAIINDGTLTKNGENSYGRLMYDNFDKDLRNSVIKDYLTVFGGKSQEIAFRDYERKKFLEFPSVIRDIVEIVIKNKGPKTESNLKIPTFIFENKENMLGWIEQTIADEGDVKHYPYKYRRSIVWGRALDVTNLFNKKIKKDTPLRKLPLKFQKLLLNQKCKLIEGEKRMLDMLGICYKVYNLGLYLTSKDKVRTQWRINITKRENLQKLRKLIKIPLKRKEKNFTEAIRNYVRYKEPLKIKNFIIKLGKINKSFTALDLKFLMRYKQVSSTYKWLKIFEKDGIIKKVKESTYGGGYYRKPAKYKLIQYK